MSRWLVDFYVLSQRWRESYYKTCIFLSLWMFFLPLCGKNFTFLWGGYHVEIIIRKLETSVFSNKLYFGVWDGVNSSFSLGHTVSLCLGCTKRVYSWPGFLECRVYFGEKVRLVWWRWLSRLKS